MLTFNYNIEGNQSTWKNFHKIIKTKIKYQLN